MNVGISIQQLDTSEQLVLGNGAGKSDVLGLNADFSSSLESRVFFHQRHERILFIFPILARGGIRMINLNLITLHFARM